MKVFATPTFVRLILDTGLFGSNVGVKAAVAATQLPSARVTLIRDADPLQPWSTATVQVDVWASGELAAGELAYRLVNQWPPSRGQLASGVYVSGGWIEESPRPLPDPDTSAARYTMELGLMLSKEHPNNG